MKPLKITALSLLIAVFVIGCRDDNQTGSDGDGDADGDGDGDGDADAGGDSGWSEDCPDTAFSFMTCIGSIEGARCPGTYTCECGEIVTPCVCEPYEAGYHFVCDDDCTGACEDSGVDDAGSDSGSDSDTDGGDAAVEHVECVDYCEAYDRIGCVDPVTDCTTTCPIYESAMTTPECVALWEALKYCVYSEEYSCDPENSIWPPECFDEDLLSCVQ